MCYRLGKKHLPNLSYGQNFARTIKVSIRTYCTGKRQAGKLNALKSGFTGVS